MSIHYASEVGLVVLSNENITTSGAATANSGEFDTQDYIDTALLTIDDRDSGTAAATITVTHSLTTGTGFVAVPTDALFNTSTGAAATFTALSTSASSQSLGLDLQKCYRYVRVEFTGTDIDHELAVVASAFKRTAS